MSSPPGPSDPKDHHERRKSLGKYVKRMSSVFKKDKSTKSLPASPTSDAPAAPVLHVQKEEEPAHETKTTTTAPETQTSAAPGPAATTTSDAAQTLGQSGIHQLNRAAVQQERARALFAQYGLTLESHEWISMTTQPIYAQRVERPIRMRVHRTCHHCGTQYGANKVCVKCEHKRCKKCPRYPKRRTAAEKEQREKEKEQQAGVTEAVQKKKKLLALTTKTGEERIYRPVKQRIRRSCHVCQAYFIPPTSTVCASCQHVRCTKCPRDPAKPEKWPHGYPGDAPAGSDSEVERPPEARRIWRKPRMRVRWRCEGCSSYFIEGKPRCPGCGHERCEKCTREPMKKAKKEPQFDPDVLRAVEEKLRALEVDTDQPTSGPEPA